MKKIIFLILLILVTVHPASAERIFLKSGDIVSGDIIHMDSDEIKVDTGTGIPVTYFQDQIEKIDGRNFETSFRTPLTDKEITDNVVMMILNSQKKSSSPSDRKLKLWEKTYRWYREDNGLIVIEHTYKNTEQTDQDGNPQSGIVKVYFSPEELSQQ